MLSGAVSPYQKRVAEASRNNAKVQNSTPSDATKEQG